MTKLDSRLHAFRPDLADSRLAGRVAAARYAEGRVMQVAAPLVTVHKSPSSDAMQLTQALMGERLHVFDEQEGWAWVQLAADSYVGYVSANALTPGADRGHASRRRSCDLPLSGCEPEDPAGHRRHAQRQALCDRYGGQVPEDLPMAIFVYADHVAPIRCLRG